MCTAGLRPSASGSLDRCTRGPGAVVGSCFTELTHTVRYVRHSRAPWRAGGTGAAARPLNPPATWGASRTPRWRPQGPVHNVKGRRESGVSGCWGAYDTRQCLCASRPHGEPTWPDPSPDQQCPPTKRQGPRTEEYSLATPYPDVWHSATWSATSPKWITMAGVPTVWC